MEFLLTQGANKKNNILVVYLQFVIYSNRYNGLNKQTMKSLNILKSFKNKRIVIFF